jgi:hypothetical protein
MFYFNDSYASITDFATSLLNREYDRVIHDSLNGLSESMDNWRFINLDPTAYFNFAIDLSDEEECFVIDPWAMIHNYRWYPSAGSTKHKIMMLLVSIIRFHHSEISANLKFNRDAERYRQSNQINTKEAKNV